MPALSPQVRVVIGALIVQFFAIGSMFAYGVFFKALESELGWSRTLLSAATSMAFLVMGLGAMVAGRASDRFGPRLVLTISGVSLGAGYLLMTSMNAPWQLFVLYGGLVGIGLATHDVVTLSTVAHWFPGKRGMMTGIVKSGTALGQVTLPLLCTALIVAYGWRSASLWLGALALVALVLAAQLMRRPKPAESAVLLDRARAASRPGRPGPSRGWAFAPARRTRQFWTLCGAQFLFFPSLMTIPVHIVAHGSDLGLGTGIAAAVLSTMGGVSIAGRLLMGFFVDRIGGRNGYLICFSTLLVSLAMLLVIRDPAWLFLFAALYGFAHGGFFTVVSPTVAEVFGMRSHGAIFGIVLFCGTLGGAIGPVLAGSVFDALGSYQVAFAILTGFSALGLLLMLTLRALPADDPATACATDESAPFSEANQA